MPLEARIWTTGPTTECSTRSAARIVEYCPGWTDLGASDPGSVLLEASRSSTDQMIYRLNRLPGEGLPRVPES